MIINACVQFVLFFLPNTIRYKLLKIFFNYNIHSTARVGLSFIFSKNCHIGKNAELGSLTIVKKIDSIYLEDNSKVGALCFITGFGENKNFQSFRHIINRECKLAVGRHSAITSRHFIDCNGGVFIGEFSTIAGVRSQILTHSIDIRDCRQDAKPIFIGDYCFIGSGTILLPGAAIPDYSIIAAGSVVTTALTKSYMLYGGVPAKPIKPLSHDQIKYFSRKEGEVC